MAHLFGLSRIAHAFVVPTRQLEFAGRGAKLPQTSSYSHRTTTSRPQSTLYLSPDMFPTESFSVLSDLSLNMDADTAEFLAGPFFGLSLFPYLGFLYFLNAPENECPKGVVVGFATCLLFVFLTIPAAIAAKTLFGVSLAEWVW